MYILRKLNVEKQTDSAAMRDALLAQGYKLETDRKQPEKEKQAAGSRKQPKATKQPKDTGGGQQEKAPDEALNGGETAFKE